MCSSVKAQKSMRASELIISFSKIGVSLSIYKLEFLHFFMYFSIRDHFYILNRSIIHSILRSLQYLTNFLTSTTCEWRINGISSNLIKVSCGVKIVIALSFFPRVFLPELFWNRLFFGSGYLHR